MRNGETRIGLYSIYSSHDVELECARKEMIDGTDLLFIAWEHLTSYSYNISNIAMITYYFFTTKNNAVIGSNEINFVCFRFGLRM